MVNKLTATQLFTKPLQFIAETTEGANPASGSWTTVGQVIGMTIKTEGGFVETAQIGPEDINDLSQGLQKHTVSIRYRATDTTFIKRAINSQNYLTPAGTISESLSLAFGTILNGAERFIYLHGCRAKSCTITAELGKPTEFSIDLVALSMDAPVASQATPTPLSSTFPTGTAVYNWLSGGQTAPLTWGGTSSTNQVPATRFSCTIERNTETDFILGSPNAIGSLPHGRRISGEFMAYWNLDQMGNSSTLEADFRAGTARQLRYFLKSTTDYIDFGSNCKITDYDKDFDSEDTNALVERCAFKALSATCAP